MVAGQFCFALEILLSPMYLHEAIYIWSNHVFKGLTYTYVFHKENH